MEQDISKVPAPDHKPKYLDLIGKPFAIGARGPDKFDCYGLVGELYKRLGMMIPEVRSPEEQERMSKQLFDTSQLWTPCEVGMGSVLTFRIGRYVSHVGMIVSPTQFVHVWEGARLGVAVERISEWERRIVGSYLFEPK